MHRRDMKCAVHDLEVMDLNPGLVKLGVPSFSVLIVLESKILYIVYRCVSFGGWNLFLLRQTTCNSDV